MEGIDELKKFISSINNKNPYEMFSIDEAALAFNLSKGRITKAVNDKEIREYKLDGKQRMLKRKDIEKWIDSKELIEYEPIKYNRLYPQVAEVRKSRRMSTSKLKTM